MPEANRIHTPSRRLFLSRLVGAAAGSLVYKCNASNATIPRRGPVKLPALVVRADAAGRMTWGPQALNHFIPAHTRVGGRIWYAYNRSNTYRDGKNPESTPTWVVLGYTDDSYVTRNEMLYLVPRNPAAERLWDPYMWTDEAGIVWLAYPQSGGGFQQDGYDGLWLVPILNPLADGDDILVGDHTYMGVGICARPFYRGRDLILPRNIWDWNRVAAERGKHLDRLVLTDPAEPFLERLTTLPMSPAGRSTYHESTVIPTSDGGYYALFRVTEATGQGGLMETRCGSDGVWSKPVAWLYHGQAGSSRPVMRRTPSGHVLAITSELGRSGMRASIAGDLDARSWPAACSSIIDERSATSYPDLEFGPDGDTAMPIYDRGRGGYGRDYADIIVASFSVRALLAGTAAVTRTLIANRGMS